MNRLRVFSGFASWAPDQLEHKIDRGDWYLLPVEADALFGDKLDDMWPKPWRRATQLMMHGSPVGRQALAGRTGSAPPIRVVQHPDPAYRF